MVMFLELIVLCSVFAFANSLSCHVCHYTSFSSNNQLINGLLAGANNGSSDCWGTPSAAMQQCPSSSSVCAVERVDAKMSMSGNGQSIDMTIKVATKQCVSVGGDQCQKQNIEDLMKKYGMDQIAATQPGVSVSYGGFASYCTCTTDGCNSGNMIKVSWVILSASILVAVLKNIALF